MANLLTYTTEQEFKTHFMDNFVAKSPIFTHDGIAVEFWESDFEHAFYDRSAKSWNAPKSTFSIQRAIRMDFIIDMLTDPTLVAYQGFNKATSLNDNESRSVVLISEMLLLVIRHSAPSSARFKTMFIIDNPYTLKRITSNPVWINNWK